MFDRRLMLSYLDGLITESMRKQAKKIEKLRGKDTEAGEEAARAIELRRGKRFERHRQSRKADPSVKAGIERRQAAKAEQKKASHSTRLEKEIDKISDQILARIGTKDPERKEEKKMMMGHRKKLETRLKKVEAREKSGGMSKREERKSKKEGPDLH